MEIEVQNISYKYKGKSLLHHVSFRFSSPNIIGIMGTNKTLLLEILDLEKKYEGRISVNHETVGFSNQRKFQKQIALISQKNVFFTATVEDEFRFIMNSYHFDGRDFRGRMLDSLRMVGLSEAFLSRRFDCLSNSEKILIKIACGFIMNPKVLLLDEVFVGLDGSSKKNLLKLLRKLRDRKDRLIVIASNDVDLLYEITDQLLILDQGTVLKYGKTTTLFKDVKFLNQNHITIPNLVSFTMLAREKKIKLSYHRDILDLIKDVYKHV